MTFYEEEIVRIKALVCPKPYLCEKVIEAKRYIDQNYSAGLCLDDIAAEATLSKFHFIRLFKRLYGFTPNQYLIHVRVVNAKRLLQNGATVAEACFSVGFDSITSFAGLFKKMTGHSPSTVLRQLVPPTVIAAYIYRPFFAPAN